MIGHIDGSPFVIHTDAHDQRYEELPPLGKAALMYHTKGEVRDLWARWGCEEQAAIGNSEWLVPEGECGMDNFRDAMFE
jgi:hypothetical protein